MKNLAIQKLLDSKAQVNREERSIFQQNLQQTMLPCTFGFKCNKEHALITDTCTVIIFLLLSVNCIYKDAIYM